MLHVFYLVVVYVSQYTVSVLSGSCMCFTDMLQVFHLDIAYVLQWLYTCFADVSDVCCKCLNYFGCMLQLFHLDVEKIDLVLHGGTHMQQSPVAVVGPTCMCVGVEGARAVGTGNGAGVDRDGATRDMERCGT
jgi:hypothetical protein